MAGTTTASWWQYARWVWLISRNMRITEPTGAELTAVKTFLKRIWNPATDTGSRPWLAQVWNEKAVNAGDQYEGDVDNEPTNVLVEMLGVAGRDLKKIPLTSTEEGWVDTLITATGNRRFGTGPYFGGVGGSELG